MSGASVAWASSAPTVASVSSTGLVEAVADGQATITATSGSATGTVTVTVQQAATVNPEILDLVGTWEVQSFIYTLTSDPTVTQDNLIAPLEASVMYLVFYDDKDLLSVTHYVDTVTTGGGPFLPVESVFDVDPWCLALADDDHDDHMHADDDCILATDPSDLIIDEFGGDELFLTFVRNGDNMTISSNDLRVEYEFDPLVGDEPATFVIIMERVILNVDRPDLT